MLKYSSYILYNVNVSELDWVCYRRYSDFLWLRQILEEQFPGYFIPPLPNKGMKRYIIHFFCFEYSQKKKKINYFFFN
jgi:hypothetical protein